MTDGQVPVDTIRQALKDSGMSQRELARNLGWFRYQPNTDKVRRSLGLAGSGGGKPRQSHVTYERALELIEGMGLDPVEYGL